MTSAPEEFVLQLARVSKRGSRYLRGLSAADRADVLASAILWCWEHRQAFNQHEKTLEQWFADRLHEERRRWRRNGRELPTDPGSRIFTEMAQLDTPELVAEAEQLYGRTVPKHPAEGGATTRRWTAAQARLPTLQLPGRPTPAASNPDNDDRPKAPIDHEIERMLRGPRVGAKDCPPCWRCMWFMGFLPGINYEPPVIAERETRLAVSAVEAQKIQIANGIRTDHITEFDFPLET